MKKIRRYLHENPELSFEENETSKYIANFYKDKDCLVETNVGLMELKLPSQVNIQEKLSLFVLTLMRYR